MLVCVPSSVVFILCPMGAISPKLHSIWSMPIRLAPSNATLSGLSAPPDQSNDGEHARQSYMGNDSLRADVFSSSLPPSSADLSINQWSAPTLGHAIVQSYPDARSSAPTLDPQPGRPVLNPDTHHQYSTPPDPRSRRSINGLSVLLFVPGVGRCDISYLARLARSIHVLLNRTSAQVHCLIHSYVHRKVWYGFGLGARTNASEEREHLFSGLEMKCTFAYLAGFHVAESAKTLHPVLFDQAGFDYVLVLSDDVTVSSDFLLDDFLSHAVSRSVDVSSLHASLASAPVRRATSAPSVHADAPEGRLLLLSRLGWRAFWECVDGIRLSQFIPSDSWIQQIGLQIRQTFRMAVWNSTKVQPFVGQEGGCVGQLRRYTDRSRWDDGVHQLGRISRGPEVSLRTVTEASRNVTPINPGKRTGKNPKKNMQWIKTSDVADAIERAGTGIAGIRKVLLSYLALGIVIPIISIMCCST